MKTISRMLLVAGLALAGAVGTAGPLNRTDVPAQPLWVLHFDADALRTTQLGMHLLGLLDQPEAQAKFAAFQVMFNFDPRRQLHGVTLYSTGPESEDGVLLVYGDFDAQRLVTLARAGEEYQSLSHGGHVIHSWIDTKKKNRPRVYAAIHDGRVLFGQRSNTVGAAIDVLNGAPSLRNSGLFPQLGTGPAYIQAASRKIDVADGDPNAAVLRQSKGIRFQMGEMEQKVTGTLTLEAGSEEIAGHITSIARGLVALMQLQTGKPGVARLAETAVLTQMGANVICTWTLPAFEIIEFLKAEAARKAAEKAAAN